LVSQADVAMYRQNAGLARYEVFDSNMSAYAVNRLEPETSRVSQ